GAVGCGDRGSFMRLSESHPRAPPGNTGGGSVVPVPVAAKVRPFHDLLVVVGPAFGGARAGDLGGRRVRAAAVVDVDHVGVEGPFVGARPEVGAEGSLQGDEEGAGAAVAQRLVGEF